MNTNWTDERTELLKAMFDQNLPSGKIAQAINEQTGASFSENSIVGKADRMGLKRDRCWSTHIDTSFWQPAKDQLLKELVAEHVSYSHIAKRLGCTRSAVGGRMRRLGLSNPTGVRLFGEEKAFRLRQRRDQENELRREKRKLQPRLRLIRSNGNSTNLRLVQVNEPAELGTLRCVEVTPRNLTLLELEPNDCRYIAGLDRLYCGNPKQSSSSYCLSHHNLVWLKPQRSAPAKPFIERRAG